MLNVLKCMSNTATFLIFLTAELKRAIVEHTVTASVSRCMSRVQSELSDLHDCLSSADANMRKLQASSVPWIWSLGAMASWAKTATAVLECLQHQLLCQAVADMSKFGAELQSSLLPTDHVANDKIFAKALAKQS